MASDRDFGPLRDLWSNLTGSAAGHYGVHAKDSVENVSETQAPFDPQHSPLRRRQGDEAAEANRPTMRSTRPAATAVLDPLAVPTSLPAESTTSTLLVTSPKPVVSPTLLIANRSAPLRIALARP